jgi:hypothetical protein
VSACELTEMYSPAAIDIAPATSFGRIIVISSIALELLLIPQETNRLLELISNQSAWARSTFLQEAKSSSRYVIVVGDLMSGSPKAFFNECFAKDHGDSVVQSAVILTEGRPSGSIQNLLVDPVMRHAITYLDGSVFSGKDLDRAVVVSANAAFVLCDKFGYDAYAIDSLTILNALALKRHAIAVDGRNMQVFVQLIRQESKALFSSAMASVANHRRARPPKNADCTTGDADVAVCIEEIKYNLFAKSAICPGIAALIFNLVRSSAGGNGDESRDGDEATYVVESERAENSFAGDGEGGVRICHTMPSGNVNAPHSVRSREAVSVAATPRQDCASSHNVRAQENVESLGSPQAAHDYTARSLREPEQSGRAPPPNVPTMTSWLCEYQTGCGYEIYRVKLPTALAGRPYLDVVSRAFSSLGILLFALEVIVRDSARVQQRVLLNPGRFKLLGVPAENWGFVIAEDKASAERLESFVFEAQDAGALVPDARAQKASCTRETPHGSAVTPATASPAPPLPRETNHAARVAGSSKIPAARPLYRLRNYYTGDDVEGALRSRVLTQHVLVCCADFFDNLDIFLRPLRAPHLAEHLTVIFLSVAAPSSRAWAQLRAYSNVYHIMGSPFQMRDLVRAGVEHAASVTLFSLGADSGSHGPASGSGGDYGSGLDGRSAVRATRSNGDANASDALYICMYRMIRSLNLTVDIICELRSEASIQYLSDSGAVDCPFDSEAFAAGSVFAPAMIDILLAQAFYNHDLVNILMHLIAGANAQHPARLPAASGASTEVAGALADAPDSNIFLVTAPSATVNMTYPDALQHLVQTKDWLALGLRRRCVGSGYGASLNSALSVAGVTAEAADGSGANLLVSEKKKPGLAKTLFNSMRNIFVGAAAAPASSSRVAGGDEAPASGHYVVCNPGSRTLIRSSDRFFVLAQVDPLSTLPDDCIDSCVGDESSDGPDDGDGDGGDSDESLVQPHHAPFPSRHPRHTRLSADHIVDSEIGAASTLRHRNAASSSTPVSSTHTLTRQVSMETTASTVFGGDASGAPPSISYRPESRASDDFTERRRESSISEWGSSVLPLAANTGESQ